MTRIPMQPGNCFICGKTLGKTAMKNHVLKEHQASTDDREQPCMLIKAEGMEYGRDYWLYMDVPLTATLKTLDTFLRKIWLECCGHLSAFSYERYAYDEIPMSRKIEAFPVGTKLHYEYDFGSTTELTITFVQHTLRPAQRNLVRLLARNAPYAFVCAKCGKPAKDVDIEKLWDGKDPFLCGPCAEKIEMRLPVTNSPRMGTCAYCGMFDAYDYIPAPVRTKTLPAQAEKK